jgi:hypothetical protein
MSGNICFFYNQAKIEKPWGACSKPAESKSAKKIALGQIVFEL